MGGGNRVTRRGVLAALLVAGAAAGYAALVVSNAQRPDTIWVVLGEQDPQTDSYPAATATDGRPIVFACDAGVVVDDPPSWFGSLADRVRTALHIRNAPSHAARARFGTVYEFTGARRTSGGGRAREAAVRLDTVGALWRAEWELPRLVRNLADAEHAVVRQSARNEQLQRRLDGTGPEHEDAPADRR